LGPNGPRLGREGRLSWENDREESKWDVGRKGVVNLGTRRQSPSKMVRDTVSREKKKRISRDQIEERRDNVFGKNKAQGKDLYQ